MILHLVRHGATETSGKSYAGRVDVALTQTGRAEATAIADKLMARPIGLIFSSPLSRARNTAEPLATRLDLPIVLEPALIEIDFGVLEGKSKADLRLKLRKTHLTESVPGGESLADVWRRAGDVLARIAQTNRTGSPQEIAVFGHFWINRLLCGRLQGLSFENACREGSYRPGTGEIRTIENPLFLD